MLSAEVRELDAVRSGDDHLAGVRIREGSPRALERVGMIEHRRVATLDDLAAPAEGAVMLEVRADRAENLALHRRITEAATEAIGAVRERP